MKANSGLKKNRTKIQMVLTALVILSVVRQFLLKCIFNFQLARVNSSLIEITSAHIYCH